MNRIWSYDALLKIHKHKSDDPIVEEWVLSNMIMHFPEQSKEIVYDFVRRHNKDEELVNAIVPLLFKNPHLVDSDTVKNAYLSSSGTIAEAYAMLLHFQHSPALVDLFEAQYGQSWKNDPYSFTDLLAKVAFLGSESAKASVRKTLNFIPEILQESDEYKLELNHGVIGVIFEANLATGCPIEELLDFIRKYLEIEENNTPLNLHLYGLLFTAVGRYCGEYFMPDDIRPLPAHAHKHHHSHQHGDENHCCCADDENCDCGDDCECRDHDPFSDSDSPSEDNDKVVFSGFLLDMVEFIWGTEVEGLQLKWDEWSRAKDSRSIMDYVIKRHNHLLEEKKKEHGMELFERWQKSTGITQKISESILAISPHFDSFPETAKLEAACMFLIILAGLLDNRSFIGIPVEDMTLEAALKCFLEDRESSPDDKKIANLLKTAEGDQKKQILDRCMNIIDENSLLASFDRALAFLLETRDIDILENVMEIEGFRTPLWGLISEAAVSVGEPILDRIEYLMETIEPDDKRVEYLFMILGNIPVEKSVQLVLKHWDKIWIHDKNKTLRGVARLGDRRFIAPLKTELKELEVLELRLYYLLCRINGVHDPLLKKVDKEIKTQEKEYRKILKLFQEKRFRELLKEKFTVELTCRKCHRTYTYLIDKIAVSLEVHETTIFTPITCKYCGSIDNYEQPDVVDTMSNSLLMALMQIDPEKENIEDFIIQIIPPDRIDDEPVTQEELLNSYLDKLGSDPENVEYLSEVGAILLELKRSEEAREYFRLALKFDPYAIDPLFSLGSFAYQEGKLHEAYDYYMRLYKVFTEIPDEDQIPSPKSEKSSDEIINDDLMKENVYISIIELCRELKKTVPPDLLEWLKQRNF